MRLMTDSASSGAPSKSDEYGSPAGPSFQDVMFGMFVPLYYNGYESPAMSVQYVLEVSMTGYKYLSESKRLVYLSSFNVAKIAVVLLFSPGNLRCFTCGATPGKVDCNGENPSKLFLSGVAVLLTVVTFGPNLNNVHP